MSDNYSQSEHNKDFPAGVTTYLDYCEAMADRIRTAHPPLPGFDQDALVQINAPFELTPAGQTTGPYKKGILLLHGLPDSAYSMRCLATHFQQQGFLVRVMTLPGHGTRPGDLLQASYHTWLETSRFGLDSLAQDCESVYALGFSMGGALVLHHLLSGFPLKGSLLLAPAIKLKHPLAFISGWHSLISWLVPRFAWLNYHPETEPGKYLSMPMQAAHEILKLTRDVKKLSLQRTQTHRLFMALTEDDETISTPACIDFFKQHADAESRLLVYSKQPQIPGDPRQINLASAHPEQSVLDYSHISLPASAEHPRYGSQGDYTGYLHYQTNQPNWQPDPMQTTQLGAIHPENLAKGQLKRLSFNPSFAAMLEQIDKFLLTTVA